MTEVICPWLSSLPIMTINNKSERNYQGKCLDWPVTTYGGDWHPFLSRVKSEHVFCQTCFFLVSVTFICPFLYV